VYIYENAIQHRCYVVITFDPGIGYEGPQGDYRYSSAPSWTSALDGLVGQTRSGHFTTVIETQYPFYWRLCGTEGWSGQVQKFLLDHPACSSLLYRLSSSGPLLMWSYGSNEASSHPPQHLHVPYRLAVLIIYSARSSLQLCLGVWRERLQWWHPTETW
jgi:hypothetical protein